MQSEHVALLTAMLDRLDVAGVFVEGLTEGDMPVFKIINEVVAKAAAKGGPQRTELRETILRHGAVGQVYRDNNLDLERVFPLDDAEALKAANPVQTDGTIEIVQQANELREDAMVKNLLAKKGIVVVVLGGAHDLWGNLARTGKRVAYLRVDTSEYTRLRAAARKRAMGQPGTM